MAKNSGIQWTDDTDNIVVALGGGWWCLMCSEGCAFCYAAKLNQNTFYSGNGLAYTGQPPQLVLREDILAGWARQTRPRLHFVSSMTDVCGEWVPSEWIQRMFDAMAAAPNQIFQVLTKRPEIFARESQRWTLKHGVAWLPANIWGGVSIENQKRADERLPFVLSYRTEKIFVSYEPALGPVDWTGWEFVDQIISGGESGPKARPSHPDWHRATRDWCERTSTAYFFKQWGEWAPIGPGIEVPASALHYFPQGQRMVRIGKFSAGRQLDGRENNAFPATDHPALKGRETLRA